MRLAGLQARVHASVDRDGVGSLAPRGEGVHGHEVIGIQAAVGGERAARSGRRGHEQRVPEGAQAFAGGLRGGKAVEAEQAGLRRPEEPAEVGGFEPVGPRSGVPDGLLGGVGKVVGIERVLGREHGHPLRDGHRFDAVVGRDRVGLRQAMEEVGPHLRGLTPGFGRAEAGEREGEVRRRLIVVAERKALRRSLGQVVGFVDDEHGVGHVPAGHGLEGGAVARREDVIVVADHHVGVREHRLGDVPGRHAGEAADLADAPEVGGFFEQVLRIDLRVGPVAADLLGVVGDAFDLVFGTGTQEHGAELVAAGEAAEFGQHLRLPRAFAGEIEQATGAAAAKEAESVT